MRRINMLAIVESLAFVFLSASIGACLTVILFRHVCH